MDTAIEFDEKRCMGCHACIAACRMEHAAFDDDTCNTLAGIRLKEISPLDDLGRPRNYFSVLACLHCTDAPCMEVCETEALYRDKASGAVLLHDDLCVGCEICKDACPHDVPLFSDEKLIKCDLCLDRLKKGRKTACEQTCPANAIKTRTPF